MKPRKSSRIADTAGVGAEAGPEGMPSRVRRRASFAVLDAEEKAEEKEEEAMVAIPCDVV